MNLNICLLKSGSSFCYSENFKRMYEIKSQNCSIWTIFKGCFSVYTERKIQGMGKPITIVRFHFFSRLERNLCSFLENDIMYVLVIFQIVT